MSFVEFPVAGDASTRSRVDHFATLLAITFLINTPVAEHPPLSIPLSHTCKWAHYELIMQAMAISAEYADSQSGSSLWQVQQMKIAQKWEIQEKIHS